MKGRLSLSLSLIVAALLLVGNAPLREFSSLRAVAPDIVQVASAADSCQTDVNLALHRTATQSSTLTFAGVVASADLAVDGNTDGAFLDGSVSHTFIDTHGWWQVDLDARRSIKTIQVFNRTDCCADQLINYYVFVSDLPFASTDLDATIAQTGVSSYFQPEQAGRPTTISIDRTGRYVRLQASGTNSLELAEVQVIGIPFVPVNLAQKGIPTQSSILTAAGIVANASLAVDGNTDGNFFDGSVSHTQLDNQAWWEIDLGSKQCILEIRVFNRTDCCADRLSNFFAFVSDSSFRSTDLNTTLNQSAVSSYFQPGTAPPVTSIPVNRTGRFVRIQLSSANYLQLTEVQILGVPDDLALNKPTTQSTTLIDGGFVANAGLAVDGDANGGFASGSVSSTQVENQPWWQVDLTGLKTIKTIQIFSETGGSTPPPSNYFVFVSRDPFVSNDLNTIMNQSGVLAFFQQAAAGRPTTIPVSHRGRYVRVQLTGVGALRLAEVLIQ